MSASVWFVSVDEIVRVVEDLFPVAGVGQDLGKVGRWLRLVRFECGLEVKQPLEGDYNCVVAPGGCCESLGAESVRELLRVLRRWGPLSKVRLSRLDVEWDWCAFSPYDVKSAGERGDVRSELRTLAKNKLWRENEEGVTAYVGDPKGVFMVRCYDRRGYTRFECEVKDSWANIMGAEWLGSDVGSSWALSWVRRGVDFVDAGSDINVSRRSLLPWWSAFVGDVPKASARVSAASVPVEGYSAGYALAVRVRAGLVALVKRYGWPYVRRHMAEVLDGEQVVAWERRIAGGEAVARSWSAEIGLLDGIRAGRVDAMVAAGDSDAPF